jgi:hypothetical protein
LFPSCKFFDYKIKDMVKQEIDRRHTSPQKYHRRDLLSQVLEDMDEENFMNKDMTIHLVLLVLIVKGESISTSLRKSQVVKEILRIENPASGLLRRVVKGIHLKAYLLLQFSLISSFLTEKTTQSLSFSRCFFCSSRNLIALSASKSPVSFTD